MKEIVSHQGSNSACNSNLLSKQFFQRLSVCLQRENESLLFERSPLSSLHPSVDGAWSHLMCLFKIRVIFKRNFLIDSTAILPTDI